GQISLAVLDVDIAREHSLSVFDDVEVGSPSPLGGEDFQVDAVTGFVDCTLGSQENLIVALAGLQLNRAGSVVSFLILPFDLQGQRSGGGTDANNGNAAFIGGCALVDLPVAVNVQAGPGRGSVRI